MRAHYTKIHLEGFQSYGKPTTIILDRGASINMIVGENGEGKSTIFNALYWAEYGQNIKQSIETWEERRPSTYRGARVIVERTDGEFDYMIARHKNFKGTTKGIKGGDSLLMFKKPVSEPKFTENHLQGGNLHKADIQEEINNQLGVDSKTYLSSILFGQRMKSIIESADKDKRLLFEKLFPMEFVEVGLENAKKDQVKLEGDLNSLDVELGKLEGKEVALREKIDDATTFKNTYEETKKKALEELETSLKEKEVSLKSLKERNSALTEELSEIVLTEYDELIAKRKTEQTLLDNLQTTQRGDTNNITSYRQNQVSHNKAIEVLKNDLENVNEVCPTCKGKIKPANIKEAKEYIKNKIKQEESILEQLVISTTELEEKVAKNAPKIAKQEEIVKTIADSISQFSENIDRKNKLLTQQAEVTSDIKHTETSIETVKSQIKSKTEEEVEMHDIPALEKDLELLQNNIKEKETEYTSVSKKLEKCQWWIKKGFGANGVKSYIFDAMLNQLNLYIQEYASQLGFGVQFSVDLSKASKPFKTLVYSGENIKDYNDFSGGQKQRVDICLAFAMHDLISHKTDINILILDEIFEGLDASGREAALMLIRHKAENKSVYVISHSDIIDSMYTKTITIKSDEIGNSYIENE